MHHIISRNSFKIIFRQILQKVPALYKNKFYVNQWYNGIMCGIRSLHTNRKWDEASSLKVTVQFERCFRLMEHISVISWRNPINLYITEKLIKFSKSLFYFYLLILNK